MKKRAMSVFIAVCLIGTLTTGCGSSKTPTQNDSPATPPAAASSGEQAAPAGGEKIRLTAGLVNAVDHPFTIGMQTFAKYVSEATDGQIEIEVFPANQLGEERDITAGLTEGTIDFCLNANGELSKRVDGYAIGDAPYLFSGPDQMQKTVMGDTFQEFHKELLDNYGIRVLSSFYLGTRHVTSGTKPIRTPEDLKGFKIRVPDQPPSVNAFEVLGANPTPVPFGELYLALQQGVVEGQENSFGQILGSKVQEVQKYLSLTGHVVQNLYLTISEKTYQKLTPEQRAIIEELAVKIADEVTAEMIELEQTEQLQTLKDAGMEVIEVDQDAFRQVALANMPANGFFDMELYKRIQEAD